ncbi:MAG: hypothetical protein V1720_17525 [bacterium]
MKQEDRLKPGHCPDCGDDLGMAYFNHGFIIVKDNRWSQKFLKYIKAEPGQSWQAVFCACGDRHIKLDTDWTKG